MDYLVLLSLLPFLCLFGNAAAEMIGEDYVIDIWAPTPTVDSLVIMGIPEEEDGEITAFALPVEPKRTQNDTNLTGFVVE